jgi:hypothetical protein
MNYLVKIWNHSDSLFKKEILFYASNDVIAMQKASAATPDGCRSTYEEVNKEQYEKEKSEKSTTEEENYIAKS